MGFFELLIIIEKLRQGVPFGELKALLQLQKLIKFIGLSCHLVKDLCNSVINTYMFMVVIITNKRRISTYILPSAILANTLLLILAVQVDLLVVDRT